MREREHRQDISRERKTLRARERALSIRLAMSAAERIQARYSTAAPSLARTQSQIEQLRGELGLLPAISATAAAVAPPAHGDYTANAQGQISAATVNSRLVSRSIEDERASRLEAEAQSALEAEAEEGAKLQVCAASPRTARVDTFVESMVRSEAIIVSFRRWEPMES